MTKEKLIEIINGLHYQCQFNFNAHLMDAMDKFFDSNVVIPKGANPHPYADALHEMAERPDNVTFSYRIDTDRVTSPRLTELKYNIKQPEPICEWQYIYKNLLTNQYDINGYLSDDEYIESNGSWHKLEETKRERK